MNSLHHQMKSGRKGSAVEQSRYICRQGKYDARGDLIHAGSGNLPDFTGGDPAKLWAGADRYERRNGAAYREHEISLPNELPLEDMRLLAEALVHAHAGAKPFEFAIHGPTGTLGGESNPHVHAMICDRVPDGIVRSMEQFYSRHNARRPELGGARKDSGGRTPLQMRDHAIATRKMSADVTNAFLAARGIATRVDHRSLRARGIDREPEKHLGQARVRAMSTEQRASFAAQRDRPRRLD